MSILNIAAYRFVTLSNLPELQQEFRQFCEEKSLKGSIVFSQEGINLMMAGTPEVIVSFKAFLESYPAFAGITYKESISAQVPFKRLFVKIKQQLTPLGVEVELKLDEGNHLPPQALKQWLDEDKDFVLLDVRNEYEIEHGTFKKATSLGLANFSDFKDAVERLPEEMKSQPIVTCCTGGIRCEKIVPFLRQKGFNEVYQLDGGILQYLHDCGDVHYDGACYVFDDRVAINKVEIV